MLVSVQFHQTFSKNVASHSSFVLVAVRKPNLPNSSKLPLLPSLSPSPSLTQRRRNFASSSSSSSSSSSLFPSSPSRSLFRAPTLRFNSHFLPSSSLSPSPSSLSSPSPSFLHQTKRFASYNEPVSHHFDDTSIFLPKTRFNSFFNFVPQQEAWIIERFGRFHRVAESGFHIIIPFFERIAYVHSLKETTIPVYPQPAITQDNVHVTLDGNVYIQIFDPMRASYGVESPIFAITQLAQTAMRSEIGKISLDRTFEERETLNARIVASIDAATKPWGIRCLRYEIKDIVPPQIIRDSMNKQADAERRRREMVLDSEGKRQYNINEAEGIKRAKELESEGYRTQQVNQAEGDAQAILIRARAQAEAIKAIASALSLPGGDEAMKMKLAEEYITQYGKLAEKSNTIIIPDDPNNIGNWVGKAMGIMNTLNAPQHKASFTNFDKK